MNILVTGANGQLGNEIRRRSVGSSHHFTFTDVAELDITDAAALLEMASNTKAEFIINCAAYTNVRKQTLLLPFSMSILSPDCPIECKVRL